MIPQLDLEADVVPGLGLGGFEVGRSITDYEDILRQDPEAVVARVHGLWQVVYQLAQIYVPSSDEWELHFDAMAEFSRMKRAGLDANLDRAVSFIARPESPPAIDLWVDVRDGVIDAVTALRGYRGSLAGVRAGMTFAEARAAEPRIETPVFADETRIAGLEGVRLWFEPADPEPDALDGTLLEGIVVFDPTRTDDGIKPY